MATATTSGIVPRLVQLFAQAGLIDEAERASYLKRHSKHKSIVDVMKREVTISSFRDLLSSEIPLPGRGSKQESSIGQQLNIVADVREDELIAMLRIRQPPLEPVIRRLEESGVVRRGDLQAGAREAEEAGTDVYTYLVRQGLLSPAVLGRFFNAPKNPIAQYCSLFLCLFMLEFNGLISREDFKGLINRIPKDTLEETLAEIRGTIELGSKQLLGKVEGGLRLQDVALEETRLDDDLVNSFPSDLIRRKLFIPLYETDRVLGVATADPLNFNLAVIIRWITGKWMRPYFAPSGEIIDQINAHFGGTREVAGPARSVDEVSASNGGAGRAEVASRSQNGPGPAAPSKKKTKSKSKAAERPSRSKKVETTVVPALRLPKELPVDSVSAVQLVTSLIESAIELQATDIHLESGRESMTVRFRLDGNLKKIMDVPASLIGPVTSRIKVLASMDVTERRRPQDGHIMLEMGDRHFDLRVATLPTVFGEKVAIRVLDSSRVMTGLGQVGFSEKQFECVTRMSTRPHGIILVTGPTGSGKTSTLYAALNELNDEVHNLITIEDPVEYQLDGINQVQVDTNIGVTFSEGLRAILRQDPNIIMVGEIRDPDTAKTAIRAALTGHLVFSTLHTNSAIGAIQALRNLGCSPYMIGSGLTGIIAQRLVRKLCQNCSKKKSVTKALASQLGVRYSSKLRFARAVGCDACLNSGYNGRIGIFEVIEMTDPLRQAVLNDESPERLLEIADAEGRLTMQADGLEKVKKGITTPEELVQKVLLEA